MSKRRISLGLKQCMANPWESFADQYPAGTEIEGEVRNITEFGLFVGLPGDIDGDGDTDVIWAHSNGYQHETYVHRNLGPGLLGPAELIDPAAEVTMGMILEGELPLDGSRFAGQLPPVVPAPTFAIRKKAVAIFTLDQYVERGIMTVQQREALIAAVRAHRNILVIGGTGSGKTIAFALPLVARLTWSFLHRCLPCLGCL